MSDHLQLQGIVDLSDENGQPLLDETGAVLLDESSPNDGLLQLQTGDLLLLAEQSDVFNVVLPLITVDLFGNINTSGILSVTLPLLVVSMTGSVRDPDHGSGIYYLKPNQRHDTYYQTLVPVTEVDTEIP